MSGKKVAPSHCYADGMLWLFLSNIREQSFIFSRIIIPPALLFFQQYGLLQCVCIGKKNSFALR